LLLPSTISRISALGSAKVTRTPPSRNWNRIGVQV
jgi:hypothetical protein